MTVNGELVSRGLDLTAEERVCLTRVFGSPSIHPVPAIRLRGYPEIIALQADPGASLSPKDPAADEVIGQIPRHSDLTYTTKPSRGALLLARVVPPELGDTSPAFIRAIEGMEKSGSEALLDELTAFATQERFAYCHYGSVGDLVIWDNWRTMHTATGRRTKHARCMHRTTLAPLEISKELTA